jgi:acetoacetyl-CoA synthetase
MSTPLWSPSREAVKRTELTRFQSWVSEKRSLELSDYRALHRWSVEQPDEFWADYWAFAGLKASSQATATVDHLEKFPGARWFPGARLNYAENLLSDRSNKTALISVLENGDRQETSYADLYRTTASVSAHLEPLVEVGDRVAGWMPNTIETVTAMLATSARGAVWSSCSPDFGAEGALDRFGQIEPKVLFACDGYHYAGKVIDIRDKVLDVVSQVSSIETVVWIPVLDLPIPTTETCTHASWGEWSSAADTELAFEQLPFDHPLYILYSSGTTGKPKCIVHGQGGTLIQHRKEHQLHLDLKPQDTLFFFTTCGWMMWNWLVSGLATGCTLVLYDGSPFHPKPDAMFDLAERERVTVFGISAKFLGTAQKEGVVPKQTHDLGAMRMLISTGSPLTHEGFQYVYDDIKNDVHLVSMTGGTDLISCFILGNPNLPVYAGELQSPGLGMAVDVWNDAGEPVREENGELVCTVPFPSCPIGFWNDPEDARFRAAYFDRFPNVWMHGDFAEVTPNDGYIIHGRSDAVLNPGGVRIGTAEIYRQVERFDEVVDAVCIGQSWDDDVRVVLFVVMRDGVELTDELIGTIKLAIRNDASPRHTPAKVIAVADIPRTMSGKIAELAVRDVVHGREVKNTSALANPEALVNFENLPALGI